MANLPGVPGGTDDSNVDDSRQKDREVVEDLKSSQRGDRYRDDDDDRGTPGADDNDSSSSIDDSRQKDREVVEQRKEEQQDRESQSNAQSDSSWNERMDPVRNKAQAVSAQLRAESGLSDPEPRQQSGPVNRPTQRAIATEIAAAEFSDATGRDYDPDDIEVTVNQDGSLDLRAQREEQFGNRGVLSESQEDTLRDASDWFEARAEDIQEANNQFGPPGVANRMPTIDDVLGLDLDLGEESAQSNSGDFARGVVESATEVANIPEWVLTAEEGIELAEYSIEETSEGRSNQLADDLAAAGLTAARQTADDVRSDPFGAAGGLATGALFGTAGGRVVRSATGGRIGGSDLSGRVLQGTARRVRDSDFLGDDRAQLDRP